MSDLLTNIKAIQRAAGVDADGKFGPRTAQAVVNLLAQDNLITAPSANPHGDSVLDARTLKNLATLDPKARDRFVQFALLAKATAATLGCDYVIISGNRSYDEQTALYNQPWDRKDNDGDGKVDEADERVTNAKAGQSNHNFGIAVDFGAFKGGVYLDGSNPSLAEKVHRACSVHAAACGLEWGGSWKSIVDMPHYEITTGLSLSQKRDLMQTKGSVL